MRFARALALAAALVAAAVAAPAPDSLLAAAIQAGYDQDYRVAGELLGRINCPDSLKPAVAFWRAALVQLELYDSGNPVLADSFYTLSDRAVVACGRRLADEPKDPTAHALLGMTQLNRANLFAWQKQRWQALRVLLGVERHFRRALELDSTQADARLGLGTTEYFRATIDRYLLGLKLFGSRARAYRLVEDAVAADPGLADAGDLLLAYMRKEDGDYREAASHCANVLERHPGNRTALRMLRDVRREAGEFRAVLELGREIDSSISVAFPRNRYGLAENRLAMAKAWRGLGRTDSLVACCDRIIAWEPYRDSVPWLPDYIAEARAMKKKAGAR